MWPYEKPADWQAAAAELCRWTLVADSWQQVVLLPFAPHGGELERMFSDHGTLAEYCQFAVSRGVGPVNVKFGQ